ncbi:MULTISPECIES: TrbC/VirB2 family protein [Xanthomonas]|uniref:TrbC/VirB2 family protein n=1 Tax=Xanthomonas manihotis TaxID=43353 RepID=A0A8I2BRG8_XANMN|nr:MULTISPECIES: TrbC/VirB2 family protein [Xanthomonas]AMV01002.1 type VI secretion protein [Xanthomonas citri pv. aurantifolii]AMV05325.1 type VI secretion protein [Xanthomonas citri pv. aurantifolii]EFF45933.1 type IV secretion system protein VirB2 [Xanthomonas citri pv. aurantifolii str. ICPB 10535]KUF37519.1 type VI secretion protein [Xanthomonas phaseoli pv. manihotis]MBO9721543.1 TrbC/VirB2 family protein [Xanthomonas phaseoli pv. manihotis]
MGQEIEKDTAGGPRKGDKVDKALGLTANALVMALVFLPQLAYAQDAGGTFGGITAFLKSITQLLIYEWGYYIGIITLAIQGYRWKTGRIDLMTLGGWGLGIGLVFFAPNIVSDLKARSSGSIQ